MSVNTITRLLVQAGEDPDEVLAPCPLTGTRCGVAGCHPVCDDDYVSVWEESSEDYLDSFDDASWDLVESQIDREVDECYASLAA